MQNKQQEYLKQRERLKYVTQNHISKKILDPDIMIEQLISDKETFKFNLESQSPYVLPKWLQVQNNLVPAVYEQVWQAVKLGPTYQYCDTQIITQLFTTSGLSLDRLGHLWSLANIASPGYLTQQELYVMLALIALVQNGYNVKDISIIRSINHPILPQLDYSFLNITVANPAINRNVAKQVHDPKMTNTIVYNGLANALLSNSVPLQVKAINHFPENIPKQLPKNSSTSDSSSAFDSCSSAFTSCSQPSFVTEFKTTNSQIPDIRKCDIEVKFAIPESRKLELNSTLSTSNLVEQIAELDVDCPISDLRISSNINSFPDKKKQELPFVFNEVTVPTTLQNGQNDKRYDFLNLSDFSNNVEPRSLDLPVFGSESNNVQEEDEFTEFQSATVVSSTDEYTDFQSASPIVKYELDSYMGDKELKSLTISNWSAEVEPKSLPMVEEGREYISSLEADKYDVFRTLIEHEDEKKPKIEDDQEENDEEEEDEEFGEFSAADVKPCPQKPVPIKDKCLDACLRLLNEGLSIFSSVSNEETLREVLSDEKGYKYFNQLKIVYETSQRFQRQFENTHLNDAIQSTWAKLSSYIKYIPSDELLDDMCTEEDVDASLCKLCETKCDLNCVRYAGNYYHVTCINLFLHFVEDSEISTMLNL